MAANGATGITSVFLPVLKASLDRFETYKSVSQEVTQKKGEQVDRSIQANAGPKTDVSSGALTGRGQQVNIVV
jgi:hypothetical protein